MKKIGGFNIVLDDTHIECNYNFRNVVTAQLCIHFDMPSVQTFWKVKDIFESLEDVPGKITTGDLDVYHKVKQLYNKIMENIWSLFPDEK